MVLSERRKPPSLKNKISFKPSKTSSRRNLKTIKITTIAFLLGFQKEKPEVQVAKNIQVGEAQVQAGIQRGIRGGVEVETGMLIVHIGVEVEMKVEIEINVAKGKGKKRSRVEGGQGVCHRGQTRLGKIELLR